jgi:benzoyl-CoA reductase subunit B
MAEEVKTTAPSQKSVETARKVWPYVKEDYGFAHRSKGEGKPIAWTCAMLPKELLFAMDVYPLNPEHYGVITGMQRRGGSKDPNVPKESVRFCRLAEEEGFASYDCGYARSTIGHALTGDLTDAPLGGLARPDMVITTSCVCDMRGKWLRYLAQKFNVPFFLIDFPERGCDLAYAMPGQRNPVLPYHSSLKRGETDVYYSPPADHEIDYVERQWRDMARFIEDVTGHKYDQDRFNETLDLAYKTSELRLEILELRKAVPAPMSSADGLSVMYPGTYTSGTQRAYDFYVELRDELKHKVKNKMGVVPDERFRLLWYGLAPWFNMSLMNYFERFGGVFIYEPIYNLAPFPPRTPENPFREMALRCLQFSGGMMGPMGSLGQTVSLLVNAARDYKAAGIVLFYLITCRPVVYPVVEIGRVLEKEFGIPYTTLECDLVDERTYNEAQTLARWDAFAERMLKKGPVAY